MESSKCCQNWARNESWLQKVIFFFINWVDIVSFRPSGSYHCKEFPKLKFWVLASSESGPQSLITGSLWCFWVNTVRFKSHSYPLCSPQIVLYHHCISYYFLLIMILYTTFLPSFYCHHGVKKSNNSPHLFKFDRVLSFHT